MPWSRADPATARQLDAPDARMGRFVLSGHVVAADGKPIPKAQVELGTRRASTDAQGSFQLLALPGESKISIAAGGYTPLAVPVLISADTDLQFELQLSATTTVSAQVDGPASPPQRNSTGPMSCCRRPPVSPVSPWLCRVIPQKQHPAV